MDSKNLPYPQETHPWLTNEQQRENDAYRDLMLSPEDRAERQRQLLQLCEELKAAGARARANKLKPNQPGIHAALPFAASWIAPVAMNPDATPLLSDCQDASVASDMDLVALAVARGCRHYAAFAAGHEAPRHLDSLAHEVLACALMRSPMHVDGFKYFRLGAMVLSDCGNEPAMIAAAADFFGVAERVGYVVRLGLAHDDRQEYWRKLLPLFPVVAEAGDLPGVSRLSLESLVGNSKSSFRRQWLRTHYQRSGVSKPGPGAG